MTKEEFKELKNRVYDSASMLTLCDMGCYFTYKAEEEPKEKLYSSLVSQCKEALEIDTGHTIAITKNKVFIIADKELLPLYNGYAHMMKVFTKKK